MRVASQLRHVTERRGAGSLFEGRGTKLQPLSLLEAIYFDNTERAKVIIEADPSQINQQDPFAGLTPLHVAIFRQNVEIVRVLATHPRTDLNLIDGFGRKPMDMCVYTKNNRIFLLVVSNVYRNEIIAII